MSEISLLILVEAGQVRSLTGPAFQLPLPNALIWGPEALPRIEAIAKETGVWPADNQLLSAAIIDRDAKRLVRAGASYEFDTPYQLTLFDRMLASAWPGYRVSRVELSCAAMADSAGIEPPPTDLGLSRRLMSAVMGDFGDEEDSDEDEEYDETPGADFRQLATQDAGHDHADLLLQYEDQDWWVSVRMESDQPFRHYQGSFVLQTLTDSGPELIHQFDQLSETGLPAEHETTRGLVVDASTKTLNMWLHPRGVAPWTNLGKEWSGWAIHHWLDNGFRRQLEFTGEAENEIPPSDLQVLSEFVPQLVEQLNFQEMMGEIKSSVRGFVRKGFGCLAMFLAVPALIAWAVTGSWRGPFAFAGTIWLMALIAYLVAARKMKRNFASLTPANLNPDEMLPKLAPESKDQRIQIVDAALADAGLPRYSMIEAYEDDDGDAVDPIMNAFDE